MILNVMNAVKSQLVSISVVNTQTVYNYGADIDKSAITVTATYKSGAMKQVTYFSISPQTATSSTITVSYNENGVTATATFNITILKLLESIIAVPTSGEYEYAEAVGATTTAFYSDGSQATVTGTLSPTSAVAQNVNVSYTESGVTKTYSMPINVYPSNSQYASGVAELVNEGSGDWTMYCKSSGTLNLRLPYSVDVWCVGGGGGGGTELGGIANGRGSGGGGGGYTALGTNITMQSNASYNIVVGGGGARATGAGVRGSTGGTSSAFTVSANGGTGGKGINTHSTAADDMYTGGNGGSGGGGIADTSSESSSGDAGAGGSNGSNGGAWRPGIGQGTLTRDFAEPDGTLRAGGGGGGRYDYYNWNTNAAQGGAGGGGNGGNRTQSPWLTGHDGVANYGGGGGGGARQGNTSSYNFGNGGSGGSGIVIIRSHRDVNINRFKYSYTGISSYWQESNDNWQLEITGNGQLTVNEATAVDIYLLGGGQGGYAGYSTTYGGYSGRFYIGGAGGQGGYVNLLSNVTLSAGTYTATIGAGGISGNGAAGGTTSLGTYQAPGGGSGASASGTITAGAAGGNAGALRGSDTPYGGGAGADATIFDFNEINRGGGGGGGYSYRYNSKSDDYSYGYASNSGGLQGGARSYTYGVSGQPRGNISALANYGGGGSGGIDSGSAGSTGYIIIRNHRS